MLTAIKTRIETNRFDETLHFYSKVQVVHQYNLVGPLGLQIIREWNEDPVLTFT